MEMPVSPDGVPSGYPVFGSTTAVVDALSRSGWDGCATASNHSWDQVHIAGFNLGILLRALFLSLGSEEIQLFQRDGNQRKGLSCTIVI